jgi:hypothetical protein
MGFGRCFWAVADVTPGTRGARLGGSGAAVLRKRERPRRLFFRGARSRRDRRATCGDRLAHLAHGDAQADENCAREIEEFNIGHNIIARAVLGGLSVAVREMREAISAGRASVAP